MSSPKKLLWLQILGCILLIEFLMSFKGSCMHFWICILGGPCGLIVLISKKTPSHFTEAKSWGQWFPSETKCCHDCWQPSWTKTWIFLVGSLEIQVLVFQEGGRDSKLDLSMHCSHEGPPMMDPSTDMLPAQRLTERWWDYGGSYSRYWYGRTCAWRFPW